MKRLLICLTLASISHAADEAAMRAAITQSLPLLERSSIIAIDERSNCFTCHHTGLPVMTFVTARERGFKIDAQNLQTQLQFTSDFLAKGRANYLQGKGQGGHAFTAGSALWTLKLGAWKADTTTEAVIEYLLGHQTDLDHWKPPSNRPPSEESPFSTTFFALEGIQHFGTAAQKERITVRIAQVRAWLLKTPAQNTEDRVFRLWSLHSVNAETKPAAQDLLRTQRDDGGWSQLENMSTDAYATGTALVALHRSGSVTAHDPAFQRGLQWLLKTQLPDGSWHVVTRSKPIQKYFESGYPHGKDQFISITAACWATTALALALPFGQ
ncbi:MAG: prenyltransferase/squalene oxidase repeat-containing protein [Prosthecobacter sp.]|uniref:prenyltransferase/squalene oxidase repeat-containing protein n=1 Tax=Prosthecobacter sp. TaxID=1965333 RepID=UPI0038FEB608